MAKSEGLIVCLIGCGAMGGIHARHLANDFRVARLILCDADGDRAEALATKLGTRGPVIETLPLEKVFDLTPPDAFLIVSPAALHPEHVRAAAATGAYVFCEKPVAADPRDIEALASELGSAATRIQVGFNRRFDRHLAALQAKLANGAAGRVEQLHLVSRDHRPPPIENLPNSAGLIAETMIHDFDTVRWLLGDEIVSITCHGATLVNPAYAEHGHIDTATTVLIGASGQQVVIQNSWRAPNGYDQRIEAMGSKAVVRVENPRETTVTFNSTTGGTVDAIKDDWSNRYIDAYQSELIAFIDAVMKGSAVSPDLYDGLAASSLANHCKNALATGKSQMVKSDLTS